MSADEKNKIAYIVMCALLFAKQNGMSPQKGFQYLLDYKGIDFLDDHYEIEHTLPLDDTIEALSDVCVRNGGVVA